MSGNAIRNEARRRFLGRVGAGVGLGTTGSALLARGAAPASDVATFPIFDVVNFGAKGDGMAKDTAAIQAAIDACSRAGGGVVYLPPGRFLSGTIALRDNVTLHLSPAATLLGSTDRSDYPAKPFPARDLDIGGFDVWALVYADGVQNVGIEGMGTIDGSGKDFPPLKKMPSLDVPSGPRPRAIFLKNCRRVALRGFRISNSACWSVHLAVCDNAVIEGLDISSEFWFNQDGIVLDSSRNIRVTDCRIDTVDDCIVFKASFPQPCEAVTVSGCVLSGQCSAIKFGTQSLGDFRNFAISNCAVHNCLVGALKFETMDGGTLEDVTVSNIVQTGGTAPLFFRIGNRGQDFGFKDVQRPRPIGVLRRVLVTGVRATLTPKADWVRTGDRLWSARRAWTMIMAGLPGHPIENVTLSDIEVTMPGGGAAGEAAVADIPEHPERYPENTMFGVLPAYGFYVRHAKGITLDNVRLELAAPDARPAFIGDDIEDLELTRFRAAARGAEHLLRLRDARGVLIQNSRPLDKVETFLRVAGNQSADVALTANDLRLAGRAFASDAGVTVAVSESGNLSSR